MKNLFFLLLTQILSISLNASAQGNVLVKSATDDSKIVLNYTDTFILTNNAVKVRLGKEVVIIENIKPGYISRTKSIQFSRVKVMKCEFEQLTKIPVLSELDNQIILNDLIQDSLLDNINIVMYYNHSDYLNGIIRNEFKSESRDLEVNWNRVKYDLTQFIKNEELSENSKSNSLSVSKNSVRLNIEAKSIKLLKVPSVFTQFELELEYQLLDLRFNEIAKESLIIRSRHSTGQNFSDNVTHILAEGLSQFIGKSQKNGLLQLIAEDAAPFSELSEIETPKNGFSSFIEARNAVVTIITESGHGSGCFISNNGYVLTNFHVVSNNDTIKVVTFQGDTLIGELSLTDPALDIALLTTEKKCKGYFELKEHELPLGQTVYAIGTPIDLNLSQSISKGIISSNIILGDIRYIQTDAEINGGNSGGALVNAKGELIGLVNAKAVGRFIEGIGFAIDLKSIIEVINISYK